MYNQSSMQYDQIRPSAENGIEKVILVSFFIWVGKLIQKYKNKPAAQTAGADLTRCNFTNRQNPSIQQNCRNSWTSNAIVMPYIVYFMAGSAIFNH